MRLYASLLMLTCGFMLLRAKSLKEVFLFTALTLTCGLLLMFVEG